MGPQSTLATKETLVLHLVPLVVCLHVLQFSEVPTEGQTHAAMDHLTESSSSRYWGET